VRLAIFLAFVPAAAWATQYQSVPQALEKIFPKPARVEERRAFLTEAQVSRARELAGVEIPSALVTSYTASREGTPLGTAYLDSHVVRTLPESLLIAVNPDGSVRNIEVLSFREPPDYLAPPRWMAEIRGRSLGPDLSLKRGIPAVTGATLTALSTVEAVRRVLALDRILKDAGGK
jgi:hypothetical protein